MGMALGSIAGSRWPRGATSRGPSVKIGSLDETLLHAHALSSTFVDWTPLERMKNGIYLCPSLELLFGYGVLFGINAILDVFLIPLKIFASAAWSNVRRSLKKKSSLRSSPLFRAVDAWARFGRRELLALLLTSVAYVAFLVPGDTHLYASLYHWVRVQSPLKLYVLYNIMDIAEKVIACFCNELCEALFLATSPPETCEPLQSSQERDVSPKHIPESPLFIITVFGITAVVISIHTMALLLQVVTINAAINIGETTLFTLLILNNFVEIKGIMWKKYSVETTFQIACGDMAERLQMFVNVSVISLQHLRSEGLGALDQKEILIILVAEIIVDTVKHYFVSKFNGMPVSAYRSFRSVFLFDIAKEKIFSTRLAVLPLVSRAPPLDPAKPSPPRQPVTISDAEYTSAGHTFLRNPCRRAGIFEYPFAALILWSATPILTQLASSGRVMSLALICTCCILLKAVVSTIVNGMALRFVCRTLLTQNEPTEGAPPRSGSKPAMLPGGGSSCSSSKQHDKDLVEGNFSKRFPGFGSSTNFPEFIGISPPTSFAVLHRRAGGFSLERDTTIAQLSTVQRFDVPPKEKK